MIPSPVGLDQVEKLEAEVGVRLPPSYRAFLCCRVLLDLDFGDYTLPAISCDEPLSRVRTELSTEVGGPHDSL
jgi:hypothetical protein